ncbi:hypothetical protein BJ165DRAFT_159811 [Panaeolus papilionaceus]|nr:hypothetical protein BJ165DRAFT_159811 [Panaeolus papilionaceus]
MPLNNRGFFFFIHSIHLSTLHIFERPLVFLFTNKWSSRFCNSQRITLWHPLTLFGRVSRHLSTFYLMKLYLLSTSPYFGKRVAAFGIARHSEFYPNMVDRAIIYILHGASTQLNVCSPTHSYSPHCVLFDNTSTFGWKVSVQFGFRFRIPKQVKRLGASKRCGVKSPVVRLEFDSPTGQVIRSNILFQFNNSACRVVIRVIPYIFRCIHRPDHDP